MIISFLNHEFLLQFRTRSGSSEPGKENSTPSGPYNTGIATLACAEATVTEAGCEASECTDAMPCQPVA